MHKWLTFILFCFNLNIAAQTSSDTLVGIILFHGPGVFNSADEKYIVVNFSNYSNLDDTIALQGKNFSRSLVLMGNKDTQIVLPRYEGIAFSFALGNDETFTGQNEFAPSQSGSATNPQIFKNKVVWVKKRGTTHLAYHDSFAPNYTHYFQTSQFSGENRLPLLLNQFGHQFKLYFYRYINYAIIAKEDNTPVDIISRRKHRDTGIWRTYPKERIYLNKGDVYEIWSTVYDGSGTEIIAPNVCKPIAVYQLAGNHGRENWFNNYGNTKLGIGCNYENPSWCELSYKLVDYSLSGSMNFIPETPLEKARYQHYIPTKVAGQYNLIEVRALQNNTLVTVGNSGRQRLLKKGETYFDSLCYPAVISSTEPTLCKYYSKFTIKSDFLFYGDRTIPPGNMGIGLYNRWVQLPAMDIADAQKKYNAFIPLNNTNKMVNMECVLHQGDTLKINGAVVSSYRTYTFDKYQSISFALDSGWHSLSASKPFIAYVHYYLYDVPTAKNGVDDIYLDSMYRPIGGGQWQFDTYTKLRLVNTTNGFLLSDISKIYPHSVRVNERLDRTLSIDTPFYRLCQYSPVKLSGRADFYQATYNLWVLPYGDSIKQAAITYTFKDTGFFTLKFITGRRDTLCDGNFDWHYDSSFVQVYIHGNPRIYLPKDTMVCKGTLLPIMAKTDGDSTLAWKPSAVFQNAQNSISNVAKIDSTLQIIASISYPGCAASEDTMQVSIFDSVKISLPKDTLLCYGSNFTQTAIVKGGDSQNYTYQWSNGDTLKVWQKNIMVPSNLSLKVNDGCANYLAKDTLKIAVGPALKLSLPTDSLVCPNSNLRISAKASGGIKSQYQYLWQNGSTDSFLQLNNIQKDTQITCILTDNCSRPDTQTIQITVVKPFVFKNIVYDSLPCPLANIDLKVSYQGGLVDSNVLKINTANLANHTYKNQDSIHFVLAAKGQYGIFTFSLSNHCPTLAKDTFVTIYEPTFKLTANINVGDTCCVNTAISTTMSLQSQKGTGINQYRVWVNGALVKDTLSALAAYKYTLAQSQPGIQTIKITATDGCGTDSFEKSITVLPSLKIVPLPDLLWCANKPYLLDPTTAGGYAAKVTWQAKIDQGTFADVTLPSVFNFGQNTQLILAANDYCSNLITDTITIQIVPKPIVPGSVNPLEACEPAAVTLNNPAFNSTVPVPLHWSIAGVKAFNTNHTAAPIYQNLTNAGSYFIRLKSMAADTAACWDTFFTVVIHPQPVADFSFLPKEPEMQGDDVQLTFNGKMASQWTWWRNDTFISNYANTTFKPSYVGNYQIKLIAYSDFGCADSITKDILVRDIYRAFVPNAFSPNGDGVNDVWKPSLVSVESATLSIYSRWGELMYTENSTSPSWDGKYQNQIVPQGNYVYVIFLKTEGKLKETLQGNILLLR